MCLLEGCEKVLEVYLVVKDWVLVILCWSFMFGISCYYWGIDIDINCLINEYFESGIGF